MMSCALLERPNDDSITVIESVYPRIFMTMVMGIRTDDVAARLINGLILLLSQHQHRSLHRGIINVNGIGDPGYV
jgi:hypothetical protein